MKYLKTYESLSNWINKDFYFLDDLDITHDTTKFVNQLVLRVQKKENPNNFLEIYPVDNNKYNINIHSGTIINPNKSANARWSNLYDKYHDINSVLEIMRKYGIITNDQFNLIITSNKYNI